MSGVKIFAVSSSTPSLSSASLLKYSRTCLEQQQQIQQQQKHQEQQQLVYTRQTISCPIKSYPTLLVPPQWTTPSWTTSSSQPNNANVNLKPQQRFFLQKAATFNYQLQQKRYASIFLDTEWSDWNRSNPNRGRKKGICEAYKMGSINCKEYNTTGKKNANDADNGTSGSYHSKSEEKSTKTSTTQTMPEYSHPVTICNETDIGENEMKSYELENNVKVLLIKQNGVFKAIGNKCPHYGAPLNTGVLGQGRVRCPWHGACFNIDTGDIEDFPGLDSLPCFKVDVQPNGEVNVQAKRKDLESQKRLKDMAKRDPENECCYVVIGGGPAGAVCAETLRQEGFTGRIVLVCRENVLPYDRVKVSKSMDIGIESIRFRNADFYEDHDIEAMVGIEAQKVDVTTRTVVLSNGYILKYDKIFIATGCRANKPPIKGAGLKNVVTIRDHAEGNEIARLLKPDMNVVCLGASFIALEAAAYMAKKVKSVSLVGRENVPLKASFGQQIGARVLRLYQENGVNMIMNSGITEIIGNEAGEVKAVKLKDGEELPCNLLIMGTGSRFYTDFLKDSGIPINDDGSINTDLNLMTTIPDVYVGGDIANAPVYSIGNQKATIGHYQLAQYHGRVAGRNMANQPTELRAVPFFFTMLFGKGFRYSGYGPYHEVYIDGDLNELKFAAYFLDEKKFVVAVASCGRDPIVAQFAELQSQGKRLHLNEVKDNPDTTAWGMKLKLN